MSLFLGPLVPLFWISGDVSAGFQSQSGLPYSHCGGECNVRSPRSTSGATLANLLAAGMQPVLTQILLQRWGCQDLNSCSQNTCEPDALPTELNRCNVLCWRTVFSWRSPNIMWSKGPHPHCLVLWALPQPYSPETFLLWALLVKLFPGHSAMNYP